MKNQPRKPSRYHCAICNKKVATANLAYVREDNPHGPRLCQAHAVIINEHFSDGLITTLKLVIIRKRLREQGHDVDAVNRRLSISIEKDQSSEILSQIFSR
ncbi:hypothetical protein HQ544_03900 [Candidatus Falkowbacteria bacterium]|nr:hypothetical protein [Candidatus Falkowbacteria bacterium]